MKNSTIHFSSKNCWATTATKAKRLSLLFNFSKLLYEPCCMYYYINSQKVPSNRYKDFTLLLLSVKAMIIPEKNYDK